jgi:hypothetical protein
MQINNIDLAVGEGLFEVTHPPVEQMFGADFNGKIDAAINVCAVRNASTCGKGHHCEL